MPTNIFEKEIRQTLNVFKASRVLVYDRPKDVVVSYPGKPIFRPGPLLPDFWFFSGRFVVLELKGTESITSIPLGNIREHQLAQMNLVKALGGFAFFLFNFRAKGWHPSARDEKRRVNEVYVVDVEFVNAFMVEHERKSIPRAYLQHLSAERHKQDARWVKQLVRVVVSEKKQKLWGWDITPLMGLGFEMNRMLMRL